MFGGWSSGTSSSNSDTGGNKVSLDDIAQGVSTVDKVFDVITGKDDSPPAAAAPAEPDDWFEGISNTAVITVGVLGFGLLLVVIAAKA